jgi:hypothetical protein
MKQYSKIICIDNDHINIIVQLPQKVSLTINKEYLVLNEEKYHNEVGVEIVNDLNCVIFYRPDRFITKEEYIDKQINKILN